MLNLLHIYNKVFFHSFAKTSTHLHASTGVGGGIHGIITISDIITKLVPALGLNRSPITILSLNSNFKG